MHLDNLLFLVIGTTFVLLRLLAQRVAKSGSDKRDDAKQWTAPTTQSGSGDSEEERVRRFLEALGQPATAKPPPKVTPRVLPRAPKSPAAAQPEEGREKFEQSRRALRKTVWTNPLPPLTTVPRPVIVDVPARATAKTAIPSSPVEQLAISTPLRVAPIPDAQGADSGDSLRELLRSPAQLRQAIVLREIFGPPRGLRMLESF